MQLYRPQELLLMIMPRISTTASTPQHSAMYSCSHQTTTHTALSRSAHEHAVVITNDIEAAKR